MKPSTLLFYLVAAFAAVGGVVFGLFVVAPAEPPQLVAGTLLNQPRELPAFQLTADDNTEFTREDLSGQWSLVFFGFANCPDVCPNTLFLLDRVVEQVAARDVSPPRVVFVSVDAERDTPEKLAAYVDYFNPDFVGATGEGDELKTLTEAMSVAYELQPEGDSYTVVHSSTVLVVDPEGRLRAIFTPPLKADEIAADMVALISR